MTVIVLALLVLLGVSSSGGSSETSVQLAAVESENAELRRRLDAPSGTETVTERVTEQVTQVQEQEAVPAPAAPLAPAGGCSPAYSGACVPTVGDVNCPDVPRKAS